MGSCLRPDPIYASLCPGPADGAVELARWFLPCLPSHGAASSTADGPTDSHGDSPPYAWGLPLQTGAWARAGVAARTLRSLRASSPRRWTPPPQGLASILVVCCSVTAPAMGVYGPARRWTSGAGTARAGRARSCLVELAWAGAYPGGEAPPDPRQAAADCRSMGLLLGAVCCCGRASVAATAPGRLAGTLHGGIFLCGRALAAASGSRLPRHFFCSWEAQCNACGATARGAARGAYPPMARHGSPHGEQAVLGLGQWPRDPRVSRCSTQPAEKTFGKDL